MKQTYNSQIGFGVQFSVHGTDRQHPPERLDQIVGDRNHPLKHVLRAKIVLLSGCRLSVLEVAH